jgi:hypothetical protein
MCGTKSVYLVSDHGRLQPRVVSARVSLSYKPGMTGARMTGLSTWYDRDDR